MADQDAWADILDQDEHILWQGRPDRGIAMTSNQIPEFVFGLFFSYFAVSSVLPGAYARGEPTLPGFLYLGVGLIILARAVTWSAFRRSRTWYTLTNRRAFIATDLPIVGRRLKSYPITDETMLELVDARLPSVYFASETRRTKNGSRVIQFGFERIADGKDVYRMMRDVQSDAAQKE